MITAKRLDNVQEYYFSKKLREVADLKAKGKQIINLGIGSPDLAPSPKVLDALNAGLSDPNAHQYQPYKGIPELRKAVASFYSDKYGVEVNTDTEILPLMGSKEGIMHISMAFLNEGDEVLLPNPGYPTYSSVTNLVQARTKYYDLQEELNWMPDLDELSKSDLSRTKIMWVNYPHMPTGTKATKEFFQELTAFAEEYQILVVNDNPYSFIQNKEPMSILSGSGRSDYVMELNSLSKSYNMAGWRIGMLLGSQKNIDAVLRVKSNMDSGMFLPLQKGAVEALHLPTTWFEEQNSIYGKRKALMLQLAEALQLEVAEDQAGLFIWAKVPENQSSAELVDELLYEKDIFITPGFIFGSNGEGFVRFSLCASEETIQQALKRVQS